MRSDDCNFIAPERAQDSTDLRQAAQNLISPALWNDWHVIADDEMLRQRESFSTRLLGHRIEVRHDETAFLDGTHIPSKRRYGYLWACPGTPSRDIVQLKLAEENDRWIVATGAIAVAVSGLRAIENFLDLAHLAFVHSGILGHEPLTEVRRYGVEIGEDGIWARDCKFHQPLASPTAREAIDVDYEYCIPRPHIIYLHKTNPLQPLRRDLIALFVQMVSEQSCIAHMLAAYLKEGLDVATSREFAQLIFAQDKPILENQIPKRLPLRPGAEISIPADVASSVYRRWLSELGITYGAIPA